MAENAGLYQKYDVKRRNGQDMPNAAYFTIDVVNDPNALAALAGYRIACESTAPVLHQALLELEKELRSGIKDGPMVQALRTPRQ